MGNRRTEMEKLKGLTLSQKIEYIWMYDKVWFLAAALVCAGIYLGITMYRGQQTNVLVSAAVVGGDAQNTEAFESLEEAVKEKLGTDEKYDKVRIQANIPEEDGSTSSQTSLTTLIGANAVDVLVCSKEIYEEYEAQDGFVNLEEILGEKTRSYEDLIRNENVLVLPNTGYIKDTFGVSYDEVYLAVLVNEQHPEGTSAFLESVLEQIK